MLDRLARRLYERLGRRYMRVLLALEIPAAVLIAVGFVGVLASFYRPSFLKGALIAITAGAFTAIAVAWSITRQGSALSEIADWHGKEKPSGAETVAAWDAAANLPMRSFRRNALLTSAIAALPSVAFTVIVLGLPLVAYPVVLAAGTVAAAYATIVNYSIAEFLIRPSIEDIAAALPENFTFTGNGLPLRKRLVLSLPVFAATTGLGVAAMVTHHGGTRMLAISAGVSLTIGLVLSLELTVLLSRAITDPIAHLREALARVRDGDYGVRVPVVSSDDLGHLSDAFNRMTRGLAEREQIRETFGTYLDKDVAGFILSGGFPDEGVEVNVSIMFCDVPGFTAFVERASPTQVISSLNALFEILVPIISHHGGHVDKFTGDGLLAVFGAPENFPDHADRALAAGIAIIDAVNATAGPLSICVGINTGHVIAGSIGGAGRLNFSVIGDAVNIAARVESATRDTGEQLLLTRATSNALIRPVELVSRGSILLKGKSVAIELIAPASRKRPDGASSPATATRGSIASQP